MSSTQQSLTLFNYFQSLLGVDEHDFKQHKVSLLGEGDHDYKPHNKDLIGAGTHDYVPHKVSIIFKIRTNYF